MISLQSQMGNTFTVYRAPAGHSAHLTWTEQLAGKVAEFAEGEDCVSLNSRLTKKPLADCGHKCLEQLEK